MVVILPVSTIFRFNFRTVLTSQRIIFGCLQFINFKQKSINQFIWRNIYSSKTVLQIVLHDPEEEPDVINKGFILSPATDSLKVLSRKRRRKCTQSYDRFTNS